MKGELTSKQAEMLNAITELMREHFDAAIFVFETDAMDKDDATVCHLSYRTCGSHCAALGLLEYAKNKMLKDP